jgi:hypothetical protein
MRLVLASQSSADRSNLAPTAETLMNCYAFPAPEGSIAPLCIRAVPSTADFVNIPGPFLRAMARVEGQLYAVVAGGLHLVRDNGTSTRIGTVPDDVNTTIVGNRDNVVVTAGGGYFVWNGTTLTQPTGGAFDNVGSAVFLDQYNVMHERDGRQIQWTEAGQPLVLDGLFFATAEARDDKIIRLVDTSGYLAVLKEMSVELWANTRLGAEAAFARVDGSVQDRGLKAFNLVAKTPDGVFYIANDNAAYMGGSGGSARISPPNVISDIKASTPSHCFYYEDRGHQFHVIRFDDRPAWVFDATTRAWHQRASGSEHKAWDIISAVECYGSWHLGSRVGNIYRFGATPRDADGPLRRTIVSRPLYNDDEPFTIAKLRVIGLFGNYDVEETAPNWITDQHGFPITDEDGQYLTASAQGAITTRRRPGRIWARFSRDGAHSWSTPRVRNIGKKGQWGIETRWQGMGQYRHFTAEINVTDEVDVPIMSEAIVEAG